jgi:acetyl-CoA carboxylase carboxyltransferase component
VAGGAYIPALCDEILMVKGTAGIFLGGPHLVEAAIGEKADIEALGGASTHTRLSGMADYEDDDEPSCLARVRRLAALWPEPPPTRYVVGTPQPPAREPADILDVIPADRSTPYDARSLLECVVDAGSWEEYKAEYGKTLLTGTARIAGRAVGIVASQRAVVRDGRGEMQVGGVIYSDAADKAARFVLNCNQKQAPLLFFQDVTGFMIGTRAEKGGIIKDGAKLVNAVANTVVPKITVFTGNSYGAGNYGMCGKAYGARFLYAWPSAAIAVMGGEQASKTLLAIQLKNRGEEVSEEEREELLSRIQSRYDDAMNPRYAAARLWVDGIVDPVDTRRVISRSLAAAASNPHVPEFKTGVLQT